MSDPFAPFQPGSPPAAVTNITWAGGVLLTGSPVGTIRLPYPNLKGTGSGVQVAYPWVVVANASGTAMRIASGQRDLGELPPGMSMKYQIGLAAQSTGGLTLTPATFDDPGGKVFASWYEEEPPGSYPSGFSAPTGNGDLATPTLFTIAAPIITQQIPLPPPAPVGEPFPPAQAWAFKLTTLGGIADGMMLSVLDRFNNAVFNTPYNIAGLGGWWVVPNYGEASTLFLQPMLGGIIGATWSGFVDIVQIPYGANGPSLSTPAMTIGQTFSALCPGAGATTTIFGPPGSGQIMQVRFISVTFPVAPAAGALLSLVGSLSATPYWQSGSQALANTPVPSSGSCDIFIGSAGIGGGFNDPAEGLNFVNNANQAANVTIAASQLPYPGVLGQYAAN